MDDRRAHRKVGHEMSVHDVDMNPIGAGPLGFNHLLAQRGEVGCQNRRSKLDVFNPFHVLDASKMRWMDVSSTALYSSSDWRADNPSSSAREKLATTP